ncbi:hypothetical protein AV940_14420 [Alteromonas sp. Mac2]|jgi:hypothetical protein|uniref:Lysozyme inhibitor LprI N-terminal domain-containing protein n=1 Tax=Alteromonas stellipolaris TaxID=233316 RepID=A0ABM5YLA1_9ALTE|nr:hypothetical protein AVL57_15765 [Alteromonas stellipolaris]AMJ87706.1 hypothetical protein AV939_14670 [Alteromonas sp. Mac1]AMJ91570.1 hypothetical protein AV940_14420 [Alteromonas sp. Mac2]ANB21580.1 hypothetical protein A6K25_10010 [Alteromonas stellipolaris]
MDCLKYFSLFLIIITFSFSAFAVETCVEEKAAVDHWNGLLRHEVTEYRRSKHRDAKSTFLACLGSVNSRDSSVKTQVYTQKNLNVRRNTSRSQQSSVRKYPSTRNFSVSSYHNFKGAKREAWDNFYKESPDCMNNSGDMTVFVKCASERKDYLHRFSSLWDERRQSMKVPIE